MIEEMGRRNLKMRVIAFRERIEARVLTNRVKVGFFEQAGPIRVFRRAMPV